LENGTALEQQETLQWQESNKARSYDLAGIRQQDVLYYETMLLAKASPLFCVGASHSRRQCQKCDKAIWQPMVA